MTIARIPRVPDDWAVLAISDVHGMTSAFLAALGAAGLVDADGRWSAPPRTALVGCGDYVDRGGDVIGLVRLLRRLESEAEAAGSMALFARGNHEEMARRAADDEPGMREFWLDYGGIQTLRSFDCTGDCLDDAGSMARAMEAGNPGVLDWIASLPQAVRWRDVLMVHGGLAPNHGIEDLGVTTDEHLWIRAGFYATDGDDPGFARYRDAGIERVVFGHTPQPAGPTLFHAGRSICIDTNAVGNPHLPADADRHLTLMKVPRDSSFEDAAMISIPTADAPERYRD